MLITGDIAGDGAVGAYERMEAGLASFGVLSFWLPGNHDGCAAAAVPEERFTRTIVTPHWLIVMLNSQVEDEVGGRLDAVELDALSAAVDGANAARRHLLVALHHPLHKLGVAWLDPQRVENADAFFTEIGRCQQSAYVISGHVHQESDLVYEGVRYLTTPSTCIQFAPNQVDFKVDDIAPGYRWLDLHPDGSIETAVERVTDRSFPVDLESGGYL
jgi:Icc protein